MAMKHMGTKNRQHGYSVAEFTASLALVAVVVFGADWMGETAQSATSSRETRSQALAIAQSQSQVAQNLAYDRLAPTTDFVPAS